MNHKNFLSKFHKIWLIDIPLIENTPFPTMFYNSYSITILVENDPLNYKLFLKIQRVDKYKL